MATRVILLVTLAAAIVTGIVYADDAPRPSGSSVGRSNFVWPKELYTVSEGEWHHIKLEDTPPRFNLAGLTNEEAIGWADAVYVDLRGDGHKELFINDGTGGRGGRGWSIYARINNKWKRIGGWIGAPIICSRYNGYYQITAWDRGGGGGSSTKCLLRFEGARYHLVRLEDWKDDGEGHMQFVGARDPKPNDN